MLRITLADGRKYEIPDVKANRDYYERWNRITDKARDRVKIEVISDSVTSTALSDHRDHETGSDLDGAGVYYRRSTLSDHTSTSLSSTSLSDRGTVAKKSTNGQAVRKGGKGKKIED